MNDKELSKISLEVAEEVTNLRLDTCDHHIEFARRLVERLAAPVAIEPFAWAVSVKAHAAEDYNFEERDVVLSDEPDPDEYPSDDWTITPLFTAAQMAKAKAQSAVHDGWRQHVTEIKATTFHTVSLKFDSNVEAFRFYAMISAAPAHPASEHKEGK